MSDSGTATDPPDEPASRVVLTYDESAVPRKRRDRVHDALMDETFLTSFRRRHDVVREGDRFEEFVSRGCGTPRDVTLRAASVEGGHRLDESSEVRIEPGD
ncbi:MAG: hypothetical protein ABEJ05_13120 [Haloglomus sp.]